MRLIDADAFADFIAETSKRQGYDKVELGSTLTIADVLNEVIAELKGEGIDGFNNAPTIEPERKTGKWIPVTERLPEIDMSHPHHEDYLVQYDSGGIDVASWSNVNRFWTDHVTEPYWNCVQFAKVIAWMPLPEPYKESER